MKILAINFKNINSLKDEHTVDFTADEFLRNPLFAITGPTGSGKSTLLDVISLALFGQIPRMGKITNAVVEEQGAVLTRNQKEAFARVKYRCKQGIFMSEWNISTARTGNLRDYEMELFALHPEEESLGLNKSDVPTKNEELIGLSYDQFVKAVVLAQGEFSKFLKAPKKERSELLEKITGTGIYRELGILAFRKFADKNREIEQVVHFLNAERERLLPEEEIEVKKEEIAALQLEIDKWTKKNRKIKEEIGYQKELKELKAAIFLKEEDLKQQENALKKFADENGKRIENHETVQGFSSDIHAWGNKRNQLQELQKEKEQLEVQKKNLRAKKESELHGIRVFLQKEVQENQVDAALEAFYKKVDHLDKQRENLRQHYKNQEHSFGRETEELNLAFDLRHFVKNPEDWRVIVEESQKAVERLKTLYEGEIPDNFEAETDGLKTRLNGLKNAEKERESLVLKQAELKELDKRWVQNQQTGEELPAEIAKLKHREALEASQVDNLELKLKNQLLEVKVKDLRQQLKAGEPCMVCGSTEHPFIEQHVVRENDLEQRIAIAKQNLEKTRRLRTEMISRQKNLTELQTVLKKDRARKKEELDQFKTKFEEEYKDFGGLEVEDWSVKINLTQKRLNQAIEGKEIIRQYGQLKRADPIFTALQELYKKGMDLKKEISSLYSGDQLLKDYQNRKSNWQQVHQQLEFVRQQLEKNAHKSKEEQTRLISLEKELLPALEAKGFATVLEAQTALLPNERYKEYRDYQKKQENKITGLKVEIKVQKSRAEELQKKLSSLSTGEDLEAQKEKIEQVLKEQTDLKNEGERLLKNNEELLKRIAEQEKKISEQQKENRRWKLLKELIGDAKGDKFNQFAQDLTLRHLLRLANKRLQHIDKRYELMIKPHAKDNLVVSDLDMGGQERAVQTLSGGETFLMSLALALALSDLASENVEINSLFIDEGFGTLDPETLDQTLDTLERLQAASNKTIGIISHVDALKERIGTQIQLAKDGRGHSSLRVISL